MGKGGKLARAIFWFLHKKCLLLIDTSVGRRIDVRIDLSVRGLCAQSRVVFSIELQRCKLADCSAA
jgi:hypothetical protein